MFRFISRCFFRDVLRYTVRVRFWRGDSDLSGGFIMACNHASHLDPFLVSLMVKNWIYWMARKEFFRTWWSSFLLHQLGAFLVNRQGVAAGAIKHAISLVRQGRIVGIFPEGEVRRDATSVLRGGDIKRGACLIAQRTGRPVIPCIILGSKPLNHWCAYRLSKPCRLWIACGEPIYPPANLGKREGRAAMAAEIEQAFRDLYHKMRHDLQNGREQTAWNRAFKQ